MNIDGKSKAKPSKPSSKSPSSTKKKKTAKTKQTKRSATLSKDTIPSSTRPPQIPTSAEVKRPVTAPGPPRASSSSATGKGGVRVVTRFRPLNKTEKKVGSEIDGPIIEIADDNLSVRFSKAAQKQLNLTTADSARFSFDYVFPNTSTQADVFRETGEAMAPELFAGFNCTILAYGQTGTGKTWSMMGIVGTENSGVIPRLVQSIFAGIERADVNIEFAVEVSYVEIYRERIKDLLHPANDNLKIRESKNKGIWIQGVTETYATSNEEVLEIMETGSRNRAIASTNMNAESSRSHSVFILKLSQKNKEYGSTKSSKLFLVDLAGSEKISKTGATGQTLKEAQTINKSLSTLGIVIKSLTTGSKHVPYRDSKLTRLLSDSLGGNSKTCLIITGTMAYYNMEETLSTLRFGSRAKLIKNKPKVNVERSISEYKQLLAAAEHKIRDQDKLITALKEELATGGDGSGVLIIDGDGDGDGGAAPEAAAEAKAAAAAGETKTKLGSEGPKAAADEPGEGKEAKEDGEAAAAAAAAAGGAAAGGEEAAKTTAGEATALLTVDEEGDVVNDLNSTWKSADLNATFKSTDLNLPRRRSRRPSTVNTIMSLQAKCTSLETECEALNEKNSELEDQVQDGKNDLENMKSKMDELQAKLTQADGLRKEAVDGVTYVLSKRLTLAQKENKLCEERIQKLQDENESLNKKLASRTDLAKSFMLQTKKTLEDRQVATPPLPSGDGKSLLEPSAGPKVPLNAEKLRSQNQALMEDLAKKCADMIQMRMELEEYKSIMRNKGLTKATLPSEPDALAYQKSLVATRDQTIELLEGALHDSNVFARKMFGEYESKIKTLKSTVTRQRWTASVLAVRRVCRVVGARCGIFPPRFASHWSPSWFGTWEHACRTFRGTGSGS